jgi:hypothetical protein
MSTKTPNPILSESYQALLENYPFISYIGYGGNEYIGIIQNVDDVITSVYDFGALRTEEEKTLYLTLGESWWWESNRLIPINVFLRRDWAPFKYSLKTLNSRDVEIKFGPMVSLKEIATRRSKRRSITLVRKLG